MLFLREYAKLIYGRPVVIIGSGPNPILPEHIHDPDTAIVCVKASGHTAKKLGVRTPDITFHSEWAFEDNLELMRDLKSKNTLQVWSKNNSGNYYRSKYKEVNFDYGVMQMLPNNFMPSFYVAEAFRDVPPFPMSYGVGIILFCANLNAKDITLVGFNPFVKERSYPSERKVMGVHEKTDIYLISNFDKQLGIRISISDKELAQKLNIHYRKPID